MSAPDVRLASVARRERVTRRRLATWAVSIVAVAGAYALAAAVLGGLDSPLGAVVGGLLLGVILNLAGTYVDFFEGQMRLVAGLLVILVVLLLRPAGLLGRTAVRRV